MTGSGGVSDGTGRGGEREDEDDVEDEEVEDALVDVDVRVWFKCCPLDGAAVVVGPNPLGCGTTCTFKC